METRYHHGSLRAAAIEAGLELIAEQSDDTFSLREVARRVGVSANALYRHFPDKGALLVTLASEGLRRLAAAQREAAGAAGEGRSPFAATGKAYVRFARDNPALFRLIFSQAARGLDDDNEPAALLRANARDATDNDEDAPTVAIRAWSLAHGLAMLVLDGRLDPDEASMDRIFDLSR